MSKTTYLDVTDTNTSFVAAGAAVEIDRCRLGQDVELRDTLTLSHMLDIRKSATTQGGMSNPIQAGQNDTHVIRHENIGCVGCLFDPLSLGVLHRAMTVSKLISTNSLYELTEMAGTMSVSLSKVNCETTDLEKLRDFCIALSRFAQASRHSRIFSNVNPRKRVFF